MRSLHDYLTRRAKSMSDKRDKASPQVAPTRAEDFAQELEKITSSSHYRLAVSGAGPFPPPDIQLDPAPVRYLRCLRRYPV